MKIVKKKIILGKGTGYSLMEFMNDAPNRNELVEDINASRLLNKLEREMTDDFASARNETDRKRIEREWFSRLQDLQDNIYENSDWNGLFSYSAHNIVPQLEDLFNELNQQPVNADIEAPIQATISNQNLDFESAADELPEATQIGLGINLKKRKVTRGLGASIGSLYRQYQPELTPVEIEEKALIKEIIKFESLVKKAKKIHSPKTPNLLLRLTELRNRLAEVKNIPREADVEFDLPVMSRATSPPRFNISTLNRNRVVPTAEPVNITIAEPI